MPLTAEKTPESTCKCIIKSNQIDHYGEYRMRAANMSESAYTFPLD